MESFFQRIVKLLLIFCWILPNVFGVSYDGFSAIYRFSPEDERRTPGQNSDGDWFIGEDVGDSFGCGNDWDCRIYTNLQQTGRESWYFVMKDIGFDVGVGLNWLPESQTTIQQILFSADFNVDDDDGPWVDHLGLNLGSSVAVSVNPNIRLPTSGRHNIGGDLNWWGLSSWTVTQFKNADTRMTFGWEARDIRGQRTDAILDDFVIAVVYNLNTGIDRIAPVEQYKDWLDQQIQTPTIAVISSNTFVALQPGNEGLQAIQCRLNNNGQIVGGTVRQPVTAQGGAESSLFCDYDPNSLSFDVPYQVQITLNGNTWTDDSVFFTLKQFNPGFCDPACVNGFCEDNVCTCQQGYTGTACDQLDCSSIDNCNGNGICTGPETCTCDSGWEGVSCDTFHCRGVQGCNAQAGGGNCTGPNQCDCNQFWGGSRCNQPSCGSCETYEICVGGVGCTCPAGFGGENCTVNLNADCSGVNDCSGNGLCIDNGVCRCDAEYQGDDCSILNCDVANPGHTGVNCDIPLCLAQNNCTGNGNCTDVNECRCFFGYTGTACQRFDCSSVNRCSGRGNCTGPAQCTCNPGWTGDECSIPICATNCSGTCNFPGECDCPRETIPPFCNPIVFDCIDVRNCSNNGLCFAQDTCFCDDGWSGRDCSIPICQLECLNNATCVAPNLCDCDVGWRGVQCETPDEGDSSEDSSSTAVIVGASVASVVVVIVASLITFYFVRRKIQQGSYSRPKPVPPKYKQLIYGSYLSPLYATKSNNNYQRLIDLLFQSNYPLLRGLLAVMPVNEHEDMSKNTIFLSETIKMSSTVIQDFIKSEVEESESASTLFRANSYATKMFKFFSKVHASEYLFQCLAEPLVYLKDEIEKESIEAEVDPSRLEDGTDQATNRWQLLLITQRIFTSIIRSTQHVPKSLRNICYQIKESTSKKYSDSEFKAIGSFLFLRFFCPALVAPHTYGLLTDAPDAAMQRYLILLSKILQNLANGVLFGKKEVGMEKLNEFMTDNQENLNKFYAEISTLSPDEDTIAVPDEVRNNSLGYFHSLVSDNMSKLETVVDESFYREVRSTMDDLGEKPSKTK